MDLGVDERRLIIEIIASLVYIKKPMGEFILKPAGVPTDIYLPLFNKRDESSGKLLSKRQMAPFIIDAIDKRSDRQDIFLKIIEIAAEWDKFHLANDEFDARATVQKAREQLGILKLMEERETTQREIERKKEIARIKKEEDLFIEKQSPLLLMMLEELAKSNDAKGRGFLLQELLRQTFDLHKITVHKSFTRNEGGEQIDGLFIFHGWHYLVECRWRKKLSDIRELDGLLGQVNRSGKQAMGLFLSINGWSENVPKLLKQNSDKSIVLMDGYDLRCVLSRQVDFKEFLLAKIARLNSDCEPYYGANEYVKEQRSKDSH